MLMKRLAGPNEKVSLKCAIMSLKRPFIRHWTMDFAWIGQQIWFCVPLGFTGGENRCRPSVYRTCLRRSWWWNHRTLSQDPSRSAPWSWPWSHLWFYYWTASGNKIENTHKQAFWVFTTERRQDMKPTKTLCRCRGPTQQSELKLHLHISTATHHVCSRGVK